MATIKSTHLIRLGLLSASAMATIGFASTASAQSDTEIRPPAEETSVGEVVVTARKRSENLQQVPLTITAFTAEAIEHAQVKDMYDVATKTPGLYFGTTGGRGGGNKLQIRNFSTGTSGGSKASVFIDGVYVSGDYSSTPLANLERVEVLKGPQSAYFGRSTFVGAVNFVTKDPGNEFTGKLDLIAATLGEGDISGAVTTPIVHDMLSNVVSFRYFTFAGPSKWTGKDGYHFGNQETFAISDKLVFHPTESIKLSWYGSYVHDRDALPATAYKPITDRNVVVNRPDGTQSRYFSGPVDFDYNSSYYQTNVRGVINNPGVDRDQFRSVVNLEATVLGQTLTSFGAYGHETLINNYDAYFLGAQTVTVPNAYGVPTSYSYNQSNYLSKVETKDYQFEARLAAPAEWRLRYLIGYNYTKLTGSTVYQFDPTTGTNAHLYASPLTIVNTDNWIGGNPASTNSIFGALYFDLTDKITVSAEARHQWEKVSSQNYLTGAYFSKVFQATLPRFNVQYKVNPHFQIYGLYSVGNNPGGFNTNAPVAYFPVGVTQAYGEERLYNYEGGIKSVWLDGKLLINAAVYHMDWKNQQVLQSYVTNYPVAGNVTALTTASARSKVTGFETEIELIPTQGLNLHATASYGKAEYVDYCSSNYYALTGVATALGCRSVAGKQQEGTPALQLSFAADYERQISNTYKGYVRADYQYQSKIYLEEWDQSWTAPANVINARVGIETGNFTVELFVRNLLDDDHSPRATRASYAAVGGAYPAVVTAYGTTTAGAAGYQDVAATPRKPRQFGIRTAFRF